MSNSDVENRWGLNGIASPTWETIKGFIISATSDNVQPFALIASEQFGSTLAMSCQTMNKIERILLPSEPAPISFLKGAVGFFRNDCATELGKSAAGVRFLGLAAALVTTLGAFEGARSLELMLRSTTDDLKIPTLRHLRELLGSLETRSHFCGFADSVVGWQILLRKEVLPVLFPTEQDRGGWKEEQFLKSTPSPEAITGLVDVFRQVARMGPATILGATIRVGAAAPWVLAFTQWCVEPPSFFIEGEEELEVLERPGSRIKVVVSSDVNMPFKVTIHHQVQNLSRLLGPSSSNFVTGMVAVESYRTWLLQELGLEDAKPRLLQEALEYAIPQVLRKMKCGRFTRLGQEARSTDNINIGHYLSPLPDLRTIAIKCATFLALKDPIRFEPPVDSILVTELPLVSRHLESLAKQCGCDRCRSRVSTEPVKDEEWCNKKAFVRSLAFIIMDIFALSLFESSSPLLLRLSLIRENGVRMRTEIFNVITTGDSGSFDDMDLVGWARNMAGHLFVDEDRSLLITSAKGQVIYPSVFDTFHIEKQGYLKLCCLQGVLRYQDDTYDVVSCPEPGSAYIEQRPDRNMALLPEHVSRPLNAFRDFCSSWKVSVQDNREISAGVILRSKANNSSLIELDPLSLIRTLRNTLLAEGCPHDHRAELEPADRFASYSRPWDDHHDAAGTTSRVNVVAVDGADDLRCFALAYAEDVCVVLRRNSCISCCLDVCRDDDVHVLVL